MQAPQMLLKYIVMKKIFVVFSLIIIFLGIVQLVYSERHTFAQKYDEEYWKDRFEHSQWALSLSKRIIGDDGLYAYIGYRLVNGYGLDGYDSEVPPLGKYFIGFSILIFDNPFYYALFFGLGTSFIFYLIAKKSINNNVGAYFAVALLFFDPLFFSQLWKSALDISQLFFLLMHVLLFINFANSENKNRKRYIFYALACGFSLGLFSQVKYAILLPIIFIPETIFFILKKIKKEYTVYVIGICVAILIVNFKFFLDGNSLIDFLKLQKYILSFYLKSQLSVHNEAIWQTLFLARFPEISNRGLISIHEWWIMWPITAIVALPASIISIFRKNTSLMWRGFGFFLLGSFIVYTFIPSYPRYLVIVFPFIYLFFVRSMQNSISLKLKYILMIFILCYGLIQMRVFLNDDPSIILNNFYYNFSHRYFQDVYQENLVSNKNFISREKFRLIVQKTLGDAEIKNIKIKEVSKNIEKERGNITLKITYLSQGLGSFSEIKILKIIKEYDKWKIDWNWNLVFNGFLPGYAVETKKIIGKRGSITGAGGEILAQDSNGYLVSVNPEKIVRTIVEKEAKNGQNITVPL